jgi:signal transduction histidine kinase
MSEHCLDIEYKLREEVQLNFSAEALVPKLVGVDEIRLSQVFKRLVQSASYLSSITHNAHCCVQIVTNLLTNAAKFTAVGSIRLVCALVDRR